MGRIYYQDIIKCDDMLFEDLDTLIQHATENYSDWCSVNRSYTELVKVFRDEKSGDLVIQYKYDDDEEEGITEPREDTFEVTWTELTTTVNY